MAPDLMPVWGVGVEIQLLCLGETIVESGFGISQLSRAGVCIHVIEQNLAHSQTVEIKCIYVK